MELADLEAFVLVAETKSVKIAGLRLKLSQSAVTRRLQSLESAIGATLIHREARPLALTPEGTEAYKHARNVLAAMEDMRSAMEPDSNTTGEFRLGISMSLGDIMLTEPIECLRREFPKLQIQAVVEESRTLMRRVEKRELDAVVVLVIDESLIPEGLRGDLLTREPLGVVAAHTLGIRKNVDLADLMEYPWALNPPGCAARDELVRACNGLRKSPRILMESSSAELKFSVIEKGLGIGLSRLSSVAASRHADRLKVIVPENFQRNVGMWLVYPSTIGRLKEPLRCLRNVLRASETTSRTPSRQPVH